MAESFLFSIVGKVLGQLGSPLLQEAKLVCCVPSELEKLTATLSTIQAVLLDAEEQQAKTHGSAEHQEMKHQLGDWLRKLKDVVHRIDDVLEDFEIVALQRQVMRRSIKRKVCNFFSCSNPLVFRITMAHKIKNVREKLDAIADDRHKFNLRVRPVDSRVVYTGRETTDSFVGPSDVFGREQSIEDVIEFLTSPSDEENVSIISITGIGGVGKTTLAKEVFNDERIKLHFVSRMWVCVSNEFDVEKLKKKITESAIDADCSTMDNQRLQIRLREALDNKRYLLILDDVWNDDRNKWMDLQKLLMSTGAYASKILVTTRRESVARLMGSKVTYDLGGLPHEECTSIFLRHSFNAGQKDQYPKLVEIGEEIVKKCKGNPLAVKTLGSSLYNKSDERDWLHVRDNEIWNLPQEEGGILRELKLSYDQLPSYLKQCFACFSIFSKDTQLYGVETINIWMAHGLIQLPNPNQELEDIGKKYIEELWSRSLIQEVEDFRLFINFKMHDLVHDLALFVAKTECTILNSGVQSSYSSIPKKVRHVSFSNLNPWREGIPSCLRKQRDVRTIYFQYELAGPTSKSFVKACISSFKRLRFLDLNASSFEALPCSIGGLKHLRFLMLSDNDQIKSLPNSICKLQSLQTLLLDGCVKLEKLPRDIGNLISLRQLEITTQERCLPEKGIASLTSLRSLLIKNCENLEFLMSDDGMQCLSALRSLYIDSCKSLVSLPTKGVRHLTALEFLSIVDCEKLDLTMDDHPSQEEAAAAKEEEEDTQFADGSLRSLQLLGIGGMPRLVGIPTWLLQDANALKRIKVSDLPNFKTLMPDSLMKNLTSLQNLEIEKCRQLTSLPEGMRSLTMLQEIRISDCPELVKSCQEDDRYKISHVSSIYFDGTKF